MKIRKPGSATPLERKAKRGFRGYPVGTICFYGPTAERASKVAIGVVLAQDEEPAFLERWSTDDTDARSDASILSEVLAFLERHNVRSVAMSNELLGCPHEEGKDYPEGKSCPQCPYWAGRDRLTGERVQ